MPPISLDAMQADTIGDLIRSIDYHLEGHNYAIIGGVALKQLGSSRATADIDLLVPPGTAQAVRQALAKHTSEYIAQGNTLFYKGSDRKSHNVDIIDSGAIGHQFPGKNDDFLKVQSARILRPALLLDLKCLSWAGRDKPQKKLHDAQDIRFLLKYMADKGIRASRQEVANATDDFLDEYCARYPDDRALFMKVLKPEQGSSTTARGGSPSTNQKRGPSK
ncbi:hypothetical protein VTK56DRAFT_4665 [Thermocarpiscus australiensis]